MISAAMQHAQRDTTRSSPSFSQAGDRVVAHVAIAPRTGHPVVGRPAECVMRPAEGGGGERHSLSFFFFMDDVISIEG